MGNISYYDKIIIDKVFKKCVDKGINKYSSIALLLGTSDSFAKAVFSSNRKKLNLYHLAKLSCELECNLEEFLPCSTDYNKLYSNLSYKEALYKSIEEKLNV